MPKKNKQSRVLDNVMDLKYRMLAMADPDYPVEKLKRMEYKMLGATPVRKRKAGASDAG